MIRGLEARPAVADDTSGPWRSPPGFVKNRASQ